MPRGRAAARYSPAQLNERLGARDMPSCTAVSPHQRSPLPSGIFASHQSRRTRSHSRGSLASPSFHAIAATSTTPTSPDLLPTLTILLAATLIACAAPEPSTGAKSPKPGPGAPAPAATATDSTSLLAKADRGRIRGDSSAKLWVVMVSDFQCPYCRQWHDEVFATVMRDYVATGKIRVAYLNYPLSIHQNAMAAAEAAMCASVQGKFWEMHDAIFRAQDRWAGARDPKPVFDSLATSVGVSPDPYHSCVSSGATRPMILADEQRASTAGVRATPTFFIGSGQVEGAVPLPDFRAALDKALAAER